MQFAVSELVNSKALPGRLVESRIAVPNADTDALSVAVSVTLVAVAVAALLMTIVFADGHIPRMVVEA